MQAECGDDNFYLKSYLSRKSKNLSDWQHFPLIKRKDFEMIELRDS